MIKRFRQCVACKAVRTENGEDVAVRVVDLEIENARLRKALEWMVNNQHLTIMIENPEHVEHFMSRAHAALEGKE